jgi:sulfite exporter TauE/SafE
MPTEVTWVTALIAGLLGSVHCVGMCSGITGAFTMTLPAPVRGIYLRLLPYLLAYNAGRIVSYSVAGAVFGYAGARLGNWISPHTVVAVGPIVSALFMIALGLYLGGWWSALVHLERVGGRLWRHLEPLGRPFLPPRGPAQALVLGLVWGWLPCGLVYSVLAWSMASGGAVPGALLMLAFGLGTAPTLLAMGSAARWVAQVTRHRRVRQAVGLVIVLAGLAMLLTPGAHHHPAPTGLLDEHAHHHPG